MNLSEEEIQDERDDGAPIEVLEQYFEARGWACERTGDGEIVASATGSWAQYELRGVWRSEDQVLQFLAFPDIKVTADKRTAIFEALSLINEQLWIGHFDIWTQTGTIMYRHALVLPEGLIASNAQCEDMLAGAIHACERYYPALQFVVWAGKTAAEAMTAAMFDTEGEA